MATIHLARRDAFELGATTVRPSLREIARNGASETIEPKVMQVLIALADAAGRVVSRDELIENCWDGRIVGEDAINRVIAKLRRVAQDAAGGDFRIETVARVGYRLSLGAPAPASRSSSMAPAAMLPDAVPAPHRSWPPRVGRGSRLIVIAAVMASVVAGVAWTWSAKIWRPAAATGMPASPMPTAVRDLETRGLSAMFEDTPEQTAEGIGYLRQATTMAPRTASIWGSLAMSYVLSLGWAAAAEQPAVVARVRDSAAHALAIDPHESRSRAALASLEPTFGNWDRKAAALQFAQDHASPDTGPLLYQQVQFLMAVGREREALARIEQLVKFSPLVPWIQAAHIDLLTSAGRLDEADKAAEAALTIWPRNRLIWFTRFDLAAFHGETERALAMTADRASWPARADPAEIALAARTARALASHDRAEADAVLASLRAQSPHGEGRLERAIRAAAALGRPREALAFAHDLYLGPVATEPRGTILPLVGLKTESERATVSLFLPPAQALWTEAGFLPLMSRIGLLAYWQRTGAPDLCRRPEMARPCRVLQDRPR